MGIPPYLLLEAAAYRRQNDSLMPRPSKEKLLSLILGALQTYEVYASDPNASDIDAIRARSQLKATLRHLVSLLGSAGSAWHIDDDEESYDYHHEELAALVGRLQSIRAAIEDDVISSIEGIVYAEAFDDLLEQAEHLQSQNYFLAAGVLGRAVLEEHLRKLCEHLSCMPAGDRPTMSDFYTSLYKGQHITKIDRAHVEAMTAVGNHAAHNKQPPLREEDVQRLLRDVRSFVALHPLP